MIELPFTSVDFLEVFAKYNRAIWPMQIAFYFLALMAMLFMLSPKMIYSRLVNLTLSFFWIWMGVIYHLIFFAPVNPAAVVFGIAFIIQGLMFLYSAFAYDHAIRYRWRFDLAGITGSIFILYALLVYPLLANYLGHSWPEMPTFGLPCPTTIFTFGILLFSRTRPPLWILIIPFLWSLIGFSAAINLGIREDFGLVVAGVVGTLLLILKSTQVDDKG